MNEHFKTNDKEYCVQTRDQNDSSVFTLIFVQSLVSLSNFISKISISATTYHQPLNQSLQLQRTWQKVHVNWTRFEKEFFSGHTNKHTHTLAKKKNYHQYHINWTYLSKRIFYFNLDFDHIQDRLTWKHNLDVYFFTSKWKQKYRSDYCIAKLKLLRSLTVDNKKSQTNRFIFAVSNVIHKPTLYDI